MKNRIDLLSILLGVAVGLGGELHVHVPGFGTIAMLDLASYFIAFPIILANWHKIGKHMRTSLKWAFAWSLASMLANAVYYVDLHFWAKCVAVTCSSWAIMATSYLVLRRDSTLFLWYLVGAGLGGWIALYYFRNGALESFASGGVDYYGRAGSSTALLIEKQIYPKVARGMLFGFVLPCFIFLRKAPNFLALCAIMATGFWLLFHGGSRSSFGIFTSAAILGIVVIYAKRTFIKIAKSPSLMMILAVIGLAISFGAYKYMASSNLLGEGELAKYEREFGEEGHGAINGRAGFDHAWELAVETIGIGAGSHLRCHSVMANSLACEGIVGFLFWVYFYAQCFWFICNRLPYSDKFGAFIFLMLLLAGWDVFGSPFGTRHKFFVIMTFIALCRDCPEYGRDALFLGMPYITQMRR